LSLKYFSNEGVDLLGIELAACQVGIVIPIPFDVVKAFRSYCGVIKFSSKRIRDDFVLRAMEKNFRGVYGCDVLLRVKKLLDEKIH
tara:strand:+ start:2829 stop:3086 length:258 start_codon:yes stop_codon:yes gene_type:complete